MRFLVRLVLLAALQGSLSTATARPPEKTSIDRHPIREQSGPGAEPVALSGTLAITVYDNFDAGTSFTEYTLQTVDGGEYEIVSDSLPFEPGDEILIEGVLESSTITPSHVSLQSGAPLRENAAIGNQSVAIILVNSIENPIEQITLREAWTKIFDPTNSESLNSWVKEVSYDKAYLSGRVFGWYTLNIPEHQLCSCALETVAASDPDIDFTKFSRIIIAWPRTPNVVCSFAGVSSVGLSTRLETQDGAVHVSLARLNGIQTISDGTAHHEFGHSLGLRHASDAECGDLALGKTCQYLEYGDQFDVMGAYDRKGHFSAPHKEKLGWLDSSNTITALSGRFKISAIESMGKDIKAVKIPISEGLYYYVEFRKPIGHDLVNYNLGFAQYGYDVYNGAMIRTNASLSHDSQLIDLSPSIDSSGSPSEQFHDSLDVTLKLNHTFRDDRNGIEITARTFPHYLSVKIARD